MCLVVVSVSHLVRLLETPTRDPALEGHRTRFLDAVNALLRVGTGKVFVTAGPHHHKVDWHITVNLGGRKPQWHVSVVDVPVGSGACFEWAGYRLAVRDICNASRLGDGPEFGHHPTEVVLGAYLS